MKAPIPTLALIIVTFAVGLLAGREIFPRKSTDAAADRDGSGGGSGRPVKKLFSEDDRDGSGGGKGGGSKSRRNSVAPAGAESVEEVYALVDVQDQFGTANRMREALGQLEADQLEALLTGMGSSSVDPRFYTARTAVFSYLAELDAARAWEFTQAHPDRQFHNAFATLAIAALARVDLPAARLAVDEIDNASLKIQARNALVTAALKNDPGIARQLLAEIEESTPAHQAYASHYPYAGSYGYGMGWSSFNGGYALHLQTNTSQLIGQWAESDPAAAEVYARELTDPSRRSAALGAIAGARARVDPDAALTWARGLDQSDGRDNAVFSVLGVLAQKEPERVSTMFDEIQPAQANSLMGSVASAWLQRDQAAALNWLESMPTSQARANAYNTVLHQLTQSDPAAAVGLLDKLPLNNRNHQIPNLVSAWAQRDFAAARDWVAGMENSSALNGALGNLLPIWIKEDREGALEFLQDPNRNIQNRSGHFSAVAGEWAAADREGALEWVHSLEDDGNRRSALSGLYYRWSTGAPEEVAAHLDSVADPDERKALLGSLANSWLTQDRDAALAWFDELPQEDRDRVDSNIVSQLSYNAPEVAAARLDQMIAAAAGEADKLRAISQSASGIAGQWATRDPHAAAAWAQGLEDDQARKQAIGQVTSHWMNYDATGASDWLRELPAGEDRDSAAKTLVNQISHHDPGAAFEWAESISDPKERFQSIQQVINQWTHRDRESARAAVEGLSGLEPSQLERLQSRVK